MLQSEKIYIYIERERERERESAMKKKNNVYESRGYSLGVRHIH